jgi:hypothetical protein
LGVKLVQLVAALAADHHRHLVDARVRDHGGEGLLGAVRGEFCAQMRVPHVVDLLLLGCERWWLCHDRPLLVGVACALV